MNLKEHYDQLYFKSLEKVGFSNFQVDKLLDADEGDRYGITLLLRPDEKVKTKIQEFLLDLKYIEPIEKLELVGNDWYQKREKVKRLSVFKLVKSSKF